MMRPLQCIFAVSLTAAFSTTFAQPGSVQTLPLGSREAVIAQLENEVMEIGIMVSTKTNPRFQGGGWYYDKKKNGTLLDFVKSKVPIILTECIQREDEGTNALCRIDFVSPINQNITLRLNSLDATTFPVVFYDGTLVLPDPEYFVQYPFGVKWLPVSGVLEKVERVDYRIKYPDGRWKWNAQTPNGVYWGCWMTALATNKCLYLNMDWVDPDIVAAEGLTGEVRFWYSVANGLYESFDIRTGKKTTSAIIRQEMNFENGAPCVTIIGPTNTQVRIQSSTNLRDWTDTTTTVQLDSSGKGNSSLDLTQPQLFFRGRLVAQ